MKYKVGDRVVIVDKWSPFTGENQYGLMDHWLGQVMTIKDVQTRCYKMVEDQKEHAGFGWSWNESCVAGLEKPVDIKNLMEYL